MISLLLEQGAEANQADEDDWTPLYIAAQQSHLETVQCLVGQEALVNQADEDDWTPLHIAAHQGHQAVVEYLNPQESITYAIVIYQLSRP